MLENTVICISVVLAMCFKFRPLLLLLLSSHVRIRPYLYQSTHGLLHTWFFSSPLRRRSRVSCSRQGGAVWPKAVGPKTQQVRHLVWALGKSSGKSLRNVFLFFRFLGWSSQAFIERQDRAILWSLEAGFWSFKLWEWKRLQYVIVYETCSARAADQKQDAACREREPEENKRNTC